MTLAEARRATPAILRILATGRTPKEVEDAERVAEAARKRAEADRLRNTFGAVAEDFVAEHLPRRRSAKPAEALIRKRLMPAWHDRPMNEISRRDVIAIVKHLASTKGRSAGYKAFAQISKMFSWALNNDRGGFEDFDVNPCRSIGITDLIGEATIRTRSLTDSELATVWQAAESLGYPYGPLYQLLMLTGQRPKEISGAAWSEIDRDRNALVVPAWRMKMKLEHVTPLTPMTAAIFDGLSQFAGDFVFTTTNGRVPVSGWSKAKVRLDRAVAERGGTEKGDFDVYDFRKTVRTGLASVGVTEHICERILAHKQSGLKRAYNHWDYLEEKREALAKWEAKLINIVQIAS
jgi:integrase